MYFVKKMNEVEQKILNDCRAEFLCSLEPNDITPFLLDFISESDYELIRNKEQFPTKQERVIKFLQIAKSKIPSIHNLAEALQTTGYHGLASKLLEKIGQLSVTAGADTFTDAVQYLKDIYKRDCEIMKQHWSKLMDYPGEFEMDDMYIDLEIMEEDRRARGKISSYQELFGAKGNDRTYRKIVLEGDPGMGKTTYVHRLVQKWAMGDEGLNSMFDLVVMVRLGEVNPHQTLVDCLPDIDDKLISSLMSYILKPQNHHKILLVLDGFDEMSSGRFYFKGLIQKQHLGNVPVPNITLLITTRISHSGDEALRHKRDCLFRTVGFHPDIVQKKFGGKIENLGSLEDQSSLMGLYRNPLFIGMAASLGSVPDELFDLMEMFGLKAVERYLVLRAKEHCDLTAPEVWDKVKHFLGNVSFLTLVNRAFFMSHKSLNEAEIKLSGEINAEPETFTLCLDIGLIWPKKMKQGQIRVPSVYSRPMNVSFPHELFREYFAAHCAARLDLLKLQIHHTTNSPFSYFLSGHSKEWKQHLLKRSVIGSTLIYPWIYHPEDLLHESAFQSASVKSIGRYVKSIGASVASESPGPNHGLFLKQLSSTYTRLFSDTSDFFNMCFDKNSSTILEHMSSLDKINITECWLHESGSENFQKWIAAQRPNLISIKRCDRKLTEAVFHSIPKQPALEHLEIQFYQDDKIIALLADVFEQQNAVGTIILQYLALGSCTVNESCRSVFTALPPTLRTLKICNCDLSKEAVVSLAQYLANPTSLKKLDVSETKAVGQGVEFFHSLPKSLSSLNISNLGSISRDAVLALGTYLERAALRELKANKNPDIGSVSEIALAMVKSNLQRAYLGQCDLDIEFIRKFLHAVACQKRQFEEVHISKKDALKNVALLEKLDSLPFVKLIW